MSVKKGFLFVAFLLFSLFDVSLVTPTYSTSVVNPNPLSADVNGDGVVDILDIATVALAWNTYRGHPKWNSTIDLNGDDVVNVIDIALVAKDFGKTWIRYDFDEVLDWDVVRGIWGIVDGSLDGFNNAEGLVYAGDMIWKECTLTAKVLIATDSPMAEAAFCVGLVDSGNFYWAGLGCWGHRVSISRMVGHVPEELIFSGNRVDVAKDVWHVVSINVSGGAIALYVDGVLELTVKDSTFASGFVGIRPWGSHVLIDYVTVSGFASPAIIRSIVSSTPRLTGWGGVCIWETDRYTNEANDSTRTTPMSIVFPSEVASNAEMAMKYMKTRGCNAVRASWDPPTSTGMTPYDEDQLQRFIEIAKGLDMWIIADCHAYYDQYQYEDQWINHWQGIITRFKDSYDKIIWEPANEPVMQWRDGSHGLEGQQAVAELARIYQRWIDMCRGMGDTHWIVVSAVCWWNSLPYEDWFPTVNDPLNKIYLNAHFYYFYEWAQDKWTVADAEANADERFDGVLATISKHKRPFFCTEYGATPYSANYDSIDVVSTAQYGGASGYSTVSLAFTRRLITDFNSYPEMISHLLYPAGGWAKDWEFGWHYGGLYGAMDIWGELLQG